MSDPIEQSDPFVAAVRRAIDARGLIAPGAGVVVAVSGGADSVALLSALRTLSAERGRGYRLTVAHLNHRLRDAANVDAAWVADLARAWSLPCATRRFDVARWARRRGQGIEEAGREARLAFFRRQAARVRASCVAVGHHADDNVETVVYRIVRGTHLRGLAGMVPSRPLTDDVSLVRPMLDCTRADIEAYCARAGLTWRTDASNAETAYRRNFIRHELLPLLREKLNPQTGAAVLRLASAARDAAELIDHQACEAFETSLRQYEGGGLALDAAVLSAFPPVVRAAAIRAALERLGAGLRQVGADRLADLVDVLIGARPAVDLPGGFEARRRDGLLILQRRPAGEEQLPAWDAPVALDLSGRTVLPDGRTIACCILPNDPQAFAEHCRLRPPGVEMIDADQVSAVLHCAPPARGAKFHPLGAPGRQTVSDFLTNLKLPPEQRATVLSISDEAGIVYLAPLRIADRAKVTPQTRRVLEVRLVGAE